MEGRRERATETGNNAGLTEEERQRVIELIAEHELSNGSGRKTPAVMDGWNFRMVKKPPQPLKAVSAAELQEMDIPDIEWIVNKILPIGLSMLGAPSKYYKSYMALGLCCDICNGKKFLNFDSKKHGCLYLDLESTRRRPKNRLKQILKEEYFPKNLYILTGTDGVQRIGEGFEEQIRQQLEAHPDIKLIVVDVLQMIRQQAKRNQTGYDRDYEDFKILKQIADSNSLGLMLIHHTRKMKDPYDVFNELSGSVGVMGALDCAWVITKDDRYSDEGTLHITGRDMESQKLKIRFNKKTFQWEYIGTEDDINARRLLKEYEDSQVAETIRRLVKQNNGHWEGSTSDIVEASKILNCQIYDDVRKVGSLINKYEGLFWAVDGINYEYSKGTKGR
ncbi:MAG: AAA family ATPase [Lachnospiraceae bacterium]